MWARLARARRPALPRHKLARDYDCVAHLRHIDRRTVVPSRWRDGNGRKALRADASRTTTGPDSITIFHKYHSSELGCGPDYNVEAKWWVGMRLQNRGHRKLLS